MRSHASWAHAHANQFRLMAWNGIGIGERHAYLWGVPLDAEGRRQAALKDSVFRRERCSAFVLDAALARDFHARLRRRPATWALGYPSALTKFADEIADAGLDGRALGWKAVITTAEVLRPHQRERLEAVFGCPVADLYGCAEIGVAGLGCARGGLHVPVESVVADLVPGEDGLFEVLLTDLHNFAQPMIRYRVGDVVADPPGDAACACGLAHPCLGTVFGRSGDTLVFPDGRRVNANLPSYIFKKHGKAGTVREYQFVQFPGGLVELRIVAGPAWSEAVRDELAVQAREVLGLEVAIRTVPRFERRGRGKHRDFVRAEDLGETAPPAGARGGGR
jgi:phenylacetate-CoA ligase